MENQGGEAAERRAELVQIPIFPLLQEVLEKLEPNDSPYAFPEQANMYVLNPDNITLHVRKVMRAARRASNRHFQSVRLRENGWLSRKEYGPPALRMGTEP